MVHGLKKVTSVDCNWLITIHSFSLIILFLSMVIMTEN